MYELKMILPSFDIKLPTEMYNLKSVTLKRLETESSSLYNTDGSCDVSNLEIRQKKVFQQLQDLKNQLINIRSQFCLSKEKVQEKQYAKTSKIEEPLHDIVINANPDCVPYGFLALKNTWKDIFNIDIKIHSHSTVLKIPKPAEEFQKRITSRANNQDIPSISITLIWKNCEYTEMICSPAMYVPIYGEVNVLRYLTRVGPKEYRYEEQPRCNEVDAILDICYEITRCSTAKARVTLIRSLSNRLQKETYFGGKKLSIADIAVYSTIQGLPASSLKEITGNFKDWLNRIERITNLRE